MTGDVVTTIDGGTLTSTTGAVEITSAAIHDVDTTADATTTTGGGGKGVGVGAAITVINVDSHSRITGDAFLDAANGISIDAVMPGNDFNTDAQSGPSGDGPGADVGVAGAFALHVAITNTQATIDSTGYVDANNDDLSADSDNLVRQHRFGDAIGSSRWRKPGRRCKCRDSCPRSNHACCDRRWRDDD